jgi:lipid A 4'-phosphatase
LPQTSASRHILIVAILIVLTFAVFSIWPSLDISVSALTYDPIKGFWINQTALSDLARNAIWNLSNLMVFVAVIGFVWSFLSQRPTQKLPRRVWVFILLLYALGPGLIVNGILKEYWGRARPADTVAFGGTATFTPPIQITDQCAHNCSFVSGEASAAMAFALSVLLILRYFRPRLAPLAYRLGQATTGVLVCIAAAQRIVTGRHFLSDTILAILLVLLIALVLLRLLKIPDVTLQNASCATVDNPSDSPYTPPT